MHAKLLEYVGWRGKCGNILQRIIVDNTIAEQYTKLKLAMQKKHNFDSPLMDFVPSCDNMNILHTLELSAKEAEEVDKVDLYINYPSNPGMTICKDVRLQF